MYRSRQNKLQKSHRSKYETQRSTAGRIGKSRKREGNSNITSNRLTIHPGFLCLGFKSETARKSTEPEDLCRERTSILNEDLHGLFNVRSSTDSPVVRRSARILRKKANQEIEECTAAAYYEQVVETSPLPKVLDKTITSHSSKSKSLFQEINEKYYVVHNKIPSCYGKVFELRIANVNFCSKLQNQVHTSFSKLNVVVHCKSKIFKMTEEINQALTGNTQTHNNMTPLSPVLGISKQNMNFNFNFDFVPSSQWVYMTPPRQRLQAPKLDDCIIEPAVLYSTRKASAVYGLKSNINIDLRNFENKQPVPVDHRYLQHLGNAVGLKQANEGYETVGSHEDDISMERCRISSGEPTNFNFLRPSIRNEPGSSQMLISRPQKTVQKLSRVETVKRKLDQCYEFMDSPSFLDGSTPVARNISQVTGAGIDDTRQEVKNYSETSFDFGFKKRLFNLDTKDNMFSFKVDSPKMFNFSKVISKN